MSFATRLQRAWLSRGALAMALLPLAWLFQLVVSLRTLAYRQGWLDSHRLDVPVVVIGNLIVGGAGKTPTVMAVVELLREHGWRPGVVSRGHGRRENGALLVDVEPHTPAAQCGDEPLLLRLRLGVPVLVGRNRVAAGRALLRLHPEVDVIVADDGLQHLQLARDVEVIVFDERGVGNGWLLPAGPLREPFAPRPPARGIVLYNAPRRSTPWPGAIGHRRLSRPVVLADWWAGTRKVPATWQALQAVRLVAAAGTARPERFFDMLRAEGLDIDALPLADHFDFATLPWPTGTTDVVITEKDAVKLPPDSVGAARIWVAPLDFRIDPEFAQALFTALNPSNRLP